jgi:hypothetical protein
LNITREGIEQVLNDSLADLFCRDSHLLKFDVSERAITHKLAEYLQARIPNLNVDCEYNRNSEISNDPKKIVIEKKRIDELFEGGITYSKLAELVSISIFPDIIVHRRTKNDENLLVVEVKKRNSTVTHDHDYNKLRAFTEISGRNPYHYKYGVFLLLDTGSNWQKHHTELHWFTAGKEET